MFYCLCVYYIPFIIFKSYGVFIDGKCCFNCDICRNVGISARIGCRIVAPFDKMVAFIRVRLLPEYRHFRALLFVLHRPR